MENNLAASSQQSRRNNGAPRANVEKTTSSILNIPTENEFEMLALAENSDQQEDEAREQIQTLPANRKVRCPPIFVYNKTVCDINSIATSLAINKDEYLQRVSRGVIQLTVKSQIHFTKFVSHFEEMDIRFYTHRLPDETPTRFVLSGLPVFSADEVMTELKSFNIEPMSVKQLSASTSGDSALFLVAFKRGSCKLQDLRKVRSLFNVIINWRPYSRKSTDIVQCFRCQQFGHGMSHCHLQPKCVKCGELHLTKDCTIPKKVSKQGTSADQGSDDRNLIKCANCSRNHTASFRGCPTRLAYLKQLEVRKAQARARQTTSSQFPRPPPSPVQPGVSFAQTLSGANVNQGSNLLTLTEFLSLARELYTRLSACTTRGMQVLALSELMAKYMCDG